MTSVRFEILLWIFIIVAIIVMGALVWYACVGCYACCWDAYWRRREEREYRQQPLLDIEEISPTDIENHV